MHQLGQVAAVLQGVGQAAFEEVLDCLDVVHRLGLDGGELGDLLGTEGPHQAPEPLLLRLVQRPRSRDYPAGRQVDQPLDLHVQALPVQRGLGQVVHERGNRAAVAAVQCPERDGGRDVSEGSHGAIVPSGDR